LEAKPEEENAGDISSPRSIPNFKTVEEHWEYLNSSNPWAEPKSSSKKFIFNPAETLAAAAKPENPET